MLIVLGFREVPRGAREAGDYWLRRVAIDPVIDYLVGLAHDAGRPVVHILPPTGEAPEETPSTTSTSDGPVLPVEDQRLRVVRSGWSAFEGSGLDRLIARERVRRVLVVGDGGVRTVSATVEDAMALGLTVAVVPDALLSADPEEARALTRSLRRQGVGALRARDARFLRVRRPLEARDAETAPSDEIPWITRATVLAAFADEVSRTGGFASAHVARVARDSRLSLRTFYDAYPGGKADCFIALYRERVDALDRAIRAATGATRDPADRVRLAVLMAVRAILSNQALARALLYEFPAVQEGALLHEQVLDRFVALLTELVTGEPLGRDGDIAARGVIGGLIALSLSPRFDCEDVDEIVEAVGLMLGGVTRASVAR
ncbi:MAG: isochorismatase family protein [Solirubrobacteraceae bacterium]|nr:isochorismatase family protein [Solirubrobacteraceae bacterium]